MLWLWSPGVVAELAAAAVLLALAVYFPSLDRNRRARLVGATLTLACALWMLSHALEIGLPVAAYKEHLVGLQLILGTVSITSWLLYIIHYLGPRKLLARRYGSLLGVMPLVAMLALATNGSHGLMWTTLGLDSANPYLPLQPAYGFLYWVCMGYLAVLTLIGSMLIGRSIVRYRYNFSRESFSLIVAAALPLALAFVEVAGLVASLRLPIGLSPWAGGIGAFILVFNLPRFHPEEVIPVARDITFERIGDCILVLDTQNRVLDMNPAAERLLGCGISEAFGLPIATIWPDGAPLAMSFKNMVESGEVLLVGRDGTRRAYHSSPSVIEDPGGRTMGHVVLLTDITEHQNMERALRESAERIREYAAHLVTAREEERTGIARELHDQLGQALTAVKMDLAALHDGLGRGIAPERGKIAAVIRLVDATTDDVRRISSELRPGILDDLGLVAAMEWNLQQFEERTGIRCALTAGDAPELGRDRRTALYRIFQELLTNVARHAAARTVHVAFGRDESRYLLAVTDDGRGMTADEANSPVSLGFVGIRERLAPFGGAVSIVSAPGEGTTVSIAIPVD